MTFLESGLRFEADVLQGQKTGFFLDQRENRRRVESLARGRDVLNAFSFSGGFSLYAARGGAKSVTDLDLSEHALAGARRNFALNQAAPGVAACHHDWVRADAFEWLAATPVRKFDLIVLDPPSLAKRETERTRAIGAYRQLSADTLRWLAPSGVLVAASCSAHVSTEEFFGAVRQAARATARPFTEWQTTGQHGSPGDIPRSPVFEGDLFALWVNARSAWARARANAGRGAQRTRKGNMRGGIHCCGPATKQECSARRSCPLTRMRKRLESRLREFR